MHAKMATPAKRSAPVSHLIAEEQAKQFLYAGGGVLFCKLCERCIDFGSCITMSWIL